MYMVDPLIHFNKLIYSIFHHHKFSRTLYFGNVESLSFPTMLSALKVIDEVMKLLNNFEVHTVHTYVYYHYTYIINIHSWSII